MSVVITICKNGDGAVLIKRLGLCSKCYAKYWREHTTAPLIHSTLYSYTRGCRCSGCSATMKAYNAAYYRRKRDAS